MRRKLSKKQIGAMGLAVLMGIQTPTMAAEILTEAATQETAEQETVEQETTQEELSTEDVESEEISTQEMLPEESIETSLEETAETSAEVVSEEASENVLEEISEEIETESVEEFGTEMKVESEAEPETETGIELYAAETQKALTDGWHQDSDGNYTYVQNGQLVKNKILQINGAYYGFSSDGIMYAEERFYGNKVNAAYADSSWHRAKPDGSLYTSQWLLDANGKWFYYDASGNEASGVAEIDGKTYLFNYDGLSMDSLYWSGEYAISDENGEWIQTPGWHKFGDNWYYIRDDGRLYEGMLSVGGHTYYMSPAMEVDIPFIFESYYGMSLDDTAYKIDSNGYATQISQDGFYDYGSNTYYVRNGKISQSWENINGNWYYFGHGGRMEQTGFTQIDDAYYYFTDDGVMASNGWGYSSSGQWYYAYSSGKLATGDTRIDGVLYHFGSYGGLKEGTYKNGNSYDVYDSDGALIGTIRSEGWNFVNGNYYYLKNGALLKDCQYKAEDGAWYGFDSNGKMRSGERHNDYWYSESGRAQTGWISKAGSWYYADPTTAILCRGYKRIKSVLYYFDDSTGEMLTQDAIINGKVVKADASGAVTVTSISPNGWSSYKGNYYYYKNGKPFTGWVGSYYIIDGIMQCNMNINDKSGCTYWVNEYGVYVKNAWVSGGEHYAKENGVLAYDEWLKIDGNWYYFASSYKCTGVWNINGKKYIFDDNGVYICAAENLPSGWNLLNGNYYYKTGDSLVSYGNKEITGEEYAFKNGKMLLNEVGDGEYNKKYYYDESGKKVNCVGWKVINGNWYYFDQTSQYLTGWAEIGGKKYYFLSDEQAGVMATGYQLINSKLYYFNADGSCWGVCGPTTGWYNADGIWYYMKGGNVVTGMKTIGGVEYIFGDDGKMYTNTVTYSNGMRYVNENGAVVTNKGWILTSKGYVYVQSNGIVCTGVHVIDGVVYYFDVNGILIS